MRAVFTPQVLRRLAWAIPLALVVVAGGILLARWLRETPAMQEFLLVYPGESERPGDAPVGFPAWLGWQHFLNSFFLLLIIRSGWQVRTAQRPAASWTRRNKGLLTTKYPPQRIGLTLWTHLSLDALWVANGVVFIVLLFATGQWMRIVPTSWDIFPNAFSAALQYASLQWPVDNGWVNYNALQLLTYFITVFIAAPLAIVTGIRMSPAWSPRFAKITRFYPIEAARKVHFPVMLWFVFFILVHVTLVLATGALRNLNHMYAMNDGLGWTGFWLFAASVAVMVSGWIAARPIILRQIAALSGTITR